MANPFTSIGLIGKHQSAEVAAALVETARFLHERGYHVLIEAETASSLGNCAPFPALPYARLGTQIDLAVIVGGDGTMLNAARHLVHHDVPLVGINQGRVGFLTDIPREEALARLAEILAGDYQEEVRSMLLGQLLRGDKVLTSSHALNDIVLNKGDLGRMIEFRLTVDGAYVYTQRSDGMIVATPTGSTAYALSANGPILHPGVDGIALVPLCPHALTARPVTLPDRCTIEIELLPGHMADVHFDGQGRIEMLPGDVLRIQRAQRGVRLLHPRQYCYFAMLREKLHWSALPRG